MNHFLFLMPYIALAMSIAAIGISLLTIRVIRVTNAVAHQDQLHILRRLDNNADTTARLRLDVEKQQKNLANRIHEVAENVDVLALQLVTVKPVATYESAVQETKKSSSRRRLRKPKTETAPAVVQ